MAVRYSLCPSCRHKLSSLTTECPVCGIPLSRKTLKRPLLFQISKEIGSLLQAEKKADAHASKTGVQSAGNKTTITGPVLSVGAKSKIKSIAKPKEKTSTFDTGGPANKLDGQSTFWRLARMEFFEALFLLLVNGAIATVVCWQLNLNLHLTYSEFWHFLLPLHLLISWAYFLLPIVLTGSSAIMLMLDFGIVDSQPEKRVSFSLFMLFSVALAPFSFLCMMLTPAHTTLAELLTGQEIRERTPELLRR